MEPKKQRSGCGNNGGMIIIIIIAVTYLAIHFLSSRVSNGEADSIEAFMASGYDHMIFYSIESRPKDFPDSLDHSEYDAFQAEVDDHSFHTYPIIKSDVIHAKDSDVRKGVSLIKAVLKDMRTKAMGAKCFEPHHGIRISKGTEHMDLVICYMCETVMIWSGPGLSQKTHTLLSDGSRKKFDRLLGAF